MFEFELWAKQSSATLNIMWPARQIAFRSAQDISCEDKSDVKTRSFENGTVCVRGGGVLCGKNPRNRPFSPVLRVSIKRICQSTTLKLVETLTHRYRIRPRMMRKLLCPEMSLFCVQNKPRPFWLKCWKTWPRHTYIYISAKMLPEYQVKYMRSRMCPWN